MPVSRTIRYGDDPDQFVEVWNPNATPSGRAVLIHGGYWRERFGLDLMDPIAEHLTRQGWQVWNIEYRRIGACDTSGIWAETSADVRSALALVGTDTDIGAAADTAIGATTDIGTDIDTGTAIAAAGPVVVIGHSAGGQLALWVAADAARALPGSNEVRPDTHARGRVDAIVALAPVADLAEADRRNLGDGATRFLLGHSTVEAPELYDDASPIARLPLRVPQLIVHGDADENVPIDLSIAYAAKAQAEGDDVQLLTPAGVDHFHVIDPTHPVWQPIQGQLDRWSTTL